MKNIKLQYVDDTSLCISRKRYGRGFRFYREDGTPVTSSPLLKRLRKLIIPPMWSDVQVCKWDDGHIQAIGRDLKGRKQYIYHSEWERQRQQEKFKKMYDFGQALPAMRLQTQADINIKEWRKAKVLALLINILDETGIRIGNSQYAHRNETYGLTTLRRKHLEVLDDKILFDYKGKSNKHREVVIEDDQLIKLIKASAELPGYELFRYKVGSSKYESIDSDDVNAYIRSVMGEQFSSKDFRTWVASRYAVELYPQAIAQKESAPRKKFSNILIRLVADELGNTPTVCKSYYIHPAILQLIDKQELPMLINDVEDDYHVLQASMLYKSEAIVMECIR